MKWIVYEPRVGSRVYLIADDASDFRLSRSIKDATRFETWKSADDARVRCLPRNGRVQGVEE